MREGRRWGAALQPPLTTLRGPPIVLQLLEFDPEFPITVTARLSFLTPPCTPPPPQAHPCPAPPPEHLWMPDPALSPALPPPFLIKGSKGGEIGPSHRVGIPLDPLCRFISIPFCGHRTPHSLPPLLLLAPSALPAPHSPNAAQPSAGCGQVRTPTRRTAMASSLCWVTGPVRCHQFLGVLCACPHCRLDPSRWSRVRGPIPGRRAEEVPRTGRGQPTRHCATHTWVSRGTRQPPPPPPGPSTAPQSGSRVHRPSDQAEPWTTA